MSIWGYPVRWEVPRVERFIYSSTLNITMNKGLHTTDPSTRYQKGGPSLPAMSRAQQDVVLCSYQEAIVVVVVGGVLGNPQMLSLPAAGVSSPEVPCGRLSCDTGVSPAVDPITFVHPRPIMTLGWGFAMSCKSIWYMFIDGDQNDGIDTKGLPPCRWGCQPPAGSPSIPWIQLTELMIDPMAGCEWECLFSVFSWAWNPAHHDEIKSAARAQCLPQKCLYVWEL